MRYFYIFMLHALLLAGSPTWAEEAFSIAYKTRIEGIPITTTRVLEQRSDGTYQIVMRSSNMFARFEEITLFEKLADGTLRPLLNQNERRVFGVGQKSETRFDWERMVATWVDDGREIETPLTRGMMDRTLYQYQLERDMRSGAAELSYEVTDRGRIRTFAFENLGVETLRVGGRELSAFRLRRITEDDERETIVWLAAELNYQIVKIYHRERDDSEYEMTMDL